MRYRRYTDDELKFLDENYAKMTNRELGKILGRNAESMANVARKRGLKKDPNTFNGQFKKGQTPWNKGKTYHVGHNNGTFKKGQRPHTWLPVGTIRKRTDRPNEFVIKVADGPVRTENWRPYAEYVWIQAGNEPPTPDEVIRFKGGFVAKSPECYAVDKLEKITRAENMSRNTIHNYPPEIVSAIRQLSWLNRELENEQC